MQQMIAARLFPRPSSAFRAVASMPRRPRHTRNSLRELSSSPSLRDPTGPAHSAPPIYEPTAYFGAQSAVFSRRSELRDDAGKLVALLSNGRAKVLPLHCGDGTLVLNADGSGLRWLSVSAVDNETKRDGFQLRDVVESPSHGRHPHLVLLGCKPPSTGADAVSYWALDVSSLPSLVSYIESTLKLPFKPARPAAFALTAIPYESSLLAQARSMLDWHARFRFCGLCGSPTVLANAGYKRICTSPKDACKSHGSVQSSSYPRVDPVTIVCVVSADGKRVLLGRQKTWAKGMYSCVAGFMEPGETMESAARREVKEETGVEIGERVQYFQSNPWPFPANLMIGMYGQAVVGGEEIRLVDDELEDARWFTRDQIRAAVSPTTVKSLSEDSLALKTAQPYATAYRLLKNWADGSFQWH